MTEQYLCKSYYDNNNIPQDCTCGMCGRLQRVVEMKDHKQQFRELVEKYSFFVKDDKLYQSGVGISFDSTLWNKFIVELWKLEAKTRCECMEDIKKVELEAMKRFGRFLQNDWAIDPPEDENRDLVSFDYIAENLIELESLPSNESSENVKSEDTGKDHLKNEELVLGKETADFIADKLIDYLEMDRLTQLGIPFKYGRAVQKLIDYVRGVRFEAKKTEERTLAKISHTGAVFTWIDEEGKQHWFRVKEITDLNTDSLSKVNRIEVIDHTKDVEDGGGRVYTRWEEGIKVTQDLQDDGRTLKIFITSLEDKE